MRLDQAIAARFPHLSRRKARELIAARRVLVNERVMTIASREVADHARIAIVDDEPELTILRETADFVAIDKPAGMPAQPTADRKTRSLEELLRVRYGAIWLVHRLDTPTSGVIVYARTREAAAELSALFAGREIRKTYAAVLDPALTEEVVVDTPIDGREARTTFRPLDARLAEVTIETGRTHQIRIHAESIGHPVAGDRRHGGTSAPRLMLHAWRLEHPRLGGMIEAPLPFGFAS